jgi:hypothetical protein
VGVKDAPVPVLVLFIWPGITKEEFVLLWLMLLVVMPDALREDAMLLIPPGLSGLMLMLVVSRPGRSEP